MALNGPMGGVMRVRTDAGTSTATPRILTAALVLGLTVFLLARPAQAAGMSASPRVTNCSDSGPGSLRQAVENAGSGATVTFALSPRCTVITLAGTIQISRRLTVEGPGASALAVSGNKLVEPFHIDAGAIVTISGLSIEKGRSPYGGAIFNDGTLTLTKSTLSDNRATTGGGGIWNDDRLTVTKSTLSDNTTGTFGGGISSDAKGTLQVTASTLTGNSASATDVNYPQYAYGGGIYAFGKTTVTRSTLSGNSVTAFGGGGGGGAIYGDGTLVVSRSTLSDNSAVIIAGVIAGDGGGGILNGGSLFVSRSTLSGNSSDVDGGGIDNGSTSHVADSTLSGNRGGDAGGGIFNDGVLTITASTLSQNSAASGGGGIDNEFGHRARAAASIVANSTSGGDCSGSIADAGYNLDDDGSCGFSARTDRSHTPAGLDPAGLRNNGGPTQTIALDAGSAAIGGIDVASLCSTPDQRGVARSVPCDIGAVELVLAR